jgi:carbohydrate-binding DOMON domain-containing protein
MSTQYRLVQSGKTASGGCSAGQGSSEPVAPRIYFIYLFNTLMFNGSNRKSQMHVTVVHYNSLAVHII